MAFASGFNGDIVNTNYVMPAVMAKSIIIPGVTVPMSIVVGAETSYWKKPNPGTATVGSAGRTVTPDQGGLTRKPIDMTQSVIISTILNGADIRANTNDSIGIQMANDTAVAMKLLNAQVLTYATTVANHTATADTGTASTDATIAKSIIDAVALYKNTNKKTGNYPVTLIVTPDTTALLLEALGNKLQIDATNRLAFEGYIGYWNGLTILESLDIADATTEYILISTDSLLVPVYPDYEMQIVDKIAGRPNSVCVQKEMPYGIDGVEKSRIFVKKNA